MQDPIRGDFKISLSLWETAGVRGDLFGDSVAVESGTPTGFYKKLYDPFRVASPIGRRPRVALRGYSPRRLP